MPDKSHPDSGTFFSLPGHRVLAIEGRDAHRFAQAQFMNDVAALAPGHWQWNGWLTPKGRVVALFALLHLDSERLWLLLPDADPARLAEGLQRFVFRSKLVLRPLPDIHAAGAFAAPALATGARIDGDPDHAITLDTGTEASLRSLRLSASPSPADPAAPLRWNACDIAHGLPRLVPEQAEAWTVQQLSLERLQAYSVRKGCYPGQEIVARTHFLGQAKRGLARLHTGQPATPGDRVLSAEREIGQVVCAAAEQALAVLPADAPADGLSIAGSPCTRQPLLDGLAR